MPRFRVCGPSSMWGARNVAVSIGHLGHTFPYLCSVVFGDTTITITNTIQQYPDSPGRNRIFGTRQKCLGKWRGSPRFPW
eukprot:908364-Prymnesium_polylepis.1